MKLVTLIFSFLIFLLIFGCIQSTQKLDSKVKDTSVISTNDIESERTNATLDLVTDNQTNDSITDSQTSDLDNGSNLDKTKLNCDNVLTLQETNQICGETLSPNPYVTQNTDDDTYCFRSYTSEGALLNFNIEKFSSEDEAIKGMKSASYESAVSRTNVEFKGYPSWKVEGALSGGNSLYVTKGSYVLTINGRRNCKDYEKVDKLMETALKRV
ncbi:MAG: hypothetical protein Q7S22_07420 [Candidatus Micrarchaeota archaeon]|nr:hypothetical protein [Candidatus Micrarchaeota archaeon]